MPCAALFDRGGVANVAGDEFDVFFDVGEPARAAARIVVEHAHLSSGAHQRLHQAGADEAAAAGDEDLVAAHGALPAQVIGGDVDPFALVVRAARGVDQPLHAIAFGKAGRGRAAAFDGVEK